MNLGLLKTEGIVTKTTKYSESSLIVTIITKDFGRISAIANNVRHSKSHMLAGLQLFAYSEIVVHESRSKTGLYKLNEMSVIEGFADIRTSLEKLAFASYFAEAANAAIAEDEPETEILSLLLNSLFALDRGLCPADKIKMVFQWRLSAIAGYEPQLDKCSCGKTDGNLYLDFGEGRLVCETHKRGGNCGKLSEGMRKIIEFICQVDGKQIFSFEAGRETIEYLDALGEKYIQTQLDKELPTLRYLKKVLKPEV